MPHNTYNINSFDPLFVSNIENTGCSIMFSYNSPSLVKQIAAGNAGKAPDNVVVVLTSNSIALYPIYREDEDLEICFLIVKHQAGISLLEWAGREVFGYADTEISEYVQKSLLNLCFCPSETGGVVLDDMGVDERRELYKNFLKIYQ